MTRATFLLALPLLALGACNVERDAANDTTTLSIDGNKVEDLADDAGNVAERAAGEIGNAAEQAGPVLENAAEDVGNAASRAGQSIENGADRAAGEIREETRDNPPSR